jgi:O-antigen ligase
VQSDLATFGGWCFLAGVFLMVTGDGLTNINEPVAALAWPWLYLLPFAVSVVLMAIAERVSTRQPSRAAIVYAPLAALLAVFALSAIFSQDRTLSVRALGYVTVIAAFWWYAAQLLEDRWLADATWFIATLAVLELAVRVIAWRLAEGLDQVSLHIDSVTWLGKLQVGWVFNLFAPLLLARFIGDRRRSVAVVNGIAWAVVAAANYLLFARMASLVFAITTVAICLLNLAYWRRWIGVMGMAVAGVAVMIATNLRMVTFVVSTLFDRSQNSGIDFRLRIWEDAWRMFLAHPIVGIGVGTFDEVAYQMPGAKLNPDFHLHGWHAHNLPLHLLAETGVLGLAAWVSLWYVVVRALVTAWKSGDAERRLFSSAALVSVFAFQAVSMTEVLIAARAEASMQMNLTIALLIVIGLRISLPAPATIRD